MIYEVPGPILSNNLIGNVEAINTNNNVASFLIDFNDYLERNGFVVKGTKKTSNYPPLHLDEVNNNLQFVDRVSLII